MILDTRGVQFSTGTKLSDLPPALSKVSRWKTVSIEVIRNHSIELFLKAADSITTFLEGPEIEWLIFRLL